MQILKFLFESPVVESLTLRLAKSLIHIYHSQSFPMDKSSTVKENSNSLINKY